MFPRAIRAQQELVETLCITSTAKDFFFLSVIKALWFILGYCTVNESSASVAEHPSLYFGTYLFISQRMQSTLQGAFTY